MGPQVQETSRQVFALDDDRVRIFCRPQFSRPPPVLVGPPFPPHVQGVCCRPGINPIQGTTSTTPLPDNYGYEYYEGTGTGSYTGEEEYEYGQLQEPIKKKRVRQRTSTVGSAKKTTKVTSTTEVPSPKRVVGRGDKGNKRKVRSLRHKDIVVSFADWQRKHSPERHQI